MTRKATADEHFRPFRHSDHYLKVSQFQELIPRLFRLGIRKIFQGKFRVEAKGRDLSGQAMFSPLGTAPSPTEGVRPCPVDPRRFGVSDGETSISPARTNRRSACALRSPRRRYRPGRPVVPSGNMVALKYQHPDACTAACSALLRQLGTAGVTGFDVIVAPAAGAVVFGFELARQAAVPFLYSERVEGRQQPRRGQTGTGATCPGRRERDHHGWDGRRGLRSSRLRRSRACRCRRLGGAPGVPVRLGRRGSACRADAQRHSGVFA